MQLVKTQMIFFLHLTAILSTDEQLTLPIKNWRGNQKPIDTFYMDNDALPKNDQVSYLSIVCLLIMTGIVCILFLRWYRRTRGSSRSRRRNFILNFLGI